MNREAGNEASIFPAWYHLMLYYMLMQGKKEIATKTTCNKDTGGKRRLQRWTREVWFRVSERGHIQMWQPLYHASK